MNDTFKPTHGHNYHVVHETKTGMGVTSCHALCKVFFEHGTRGKRRPTCTACMKLDNPLLLTVDDRKFFATVVTLGVWRDAPKARSFHRLVASDYLDADAKLTRRGRVLADDWKLGPVPMQDADNIVHARAPLDMYPRCKKNGRLADVNAMTLSNYEGLRKVEGSLVISCLACLGM